jgi:hypothetical protein
MHVQKDVIEMLLPTISGNNNKMAPVEQDPRKDQVDPCKSINAWALFRDTRSLEESFKSCKSLRNYIKQ